MNDIVNPDLKNQVKVRSIRFVQGYRSDDPARHPVWAVIIEGLGVALAINAVTEKRAEDLMNMLKECKNLDFLMNVDLTDEALKKMTGHLDG